MISTGDDLETKARHPGVPFDFTMIGKSSLEEPFRLLTVPDRYRRVPPATPNGQPLDVAHMYLDFAKALADGTPCETDFDHGVKRHRLLQTIVDAAASGERRPFATATA